tara:strand:- start:169 stop:507 length:339 start_codon:yes stop_codon:yes gene_type:complete
MYIFKRIDETLIQWISDSDTPKSSSPSLSPIKNSPINKNTTLIDIMDDKKYIEIKEERRFVCSDQGEICHSDSEIYYNNNKSDSDVQPDFLIRESNVIYLEQNRKLCCCVIL